MDDNELRAKIVNALTSQGFSINPHLKLANNEKETLKNIHLSKRKEQLIMHKNFIIDNIDKIKEYMVSGRDLDPSKIDLKLIEVKRNSLYSKLFLWWNLIWWSIPYDRPIGRRMNFILWDEYHQAPLGLFCLQSPPLKSTIRDNFLKINIKNSDYWINQSLYGQRIGSIPPYNELLGGKMVMLSIVSNEIRHIYAEKYRSRTTIMKKRYLPNRLLFITTTSAFGKSSVYERLVYKGIPVGEFLGYTTGSGTFHLSEEIYKDSLNYLEMNGINVKRGYGTGTSRKLRLIEIALRRLKISKFLYHNINRGYYLFSNVENLHEVIHEDSSPLWYDRPFSDLKDFWLTRWCLPRSRNKDSWKRFDKYEFIGKCIAEIDNL